MKQATKEVIQGTYGWHMKHWLDTVHGSMDITPTPVYKLNTTPGAIPAYGR